MYYLYPRIPKPYAVQLADHRANLPIQALIDLSENIDHPNLRFAPTGGTRIDEIGLRNLQMLIRQTAAYYSYPSALRLKDAGVFDKNCAKVLYENMHIHPVEASSLGIWMYLTVVLLPDVVRWRFSAGSENTSMERFIGSARGLRRNAFGRLWWRSHLFYYAVNKSDPYVLLSALTEDDQIQISERPSLSGNPRLAKEVAVSYLLAQRDIERQGLQIDRRAVLRDALKRLSRIIPITMLDMLDESESQQVINTMFRQAVESMVHRSESKM
ncbi:MAG: hypothetical protein OHK0046_36920 [Anaerolineae bacterium]